MKAVGNRQSVGSQELKADRYEAARKLRHCGIPDAKGAVAALITAVAPGTA